MKAIPTTIFLVGCLLSGLALGFGLHSPDVRADAPPARPLDLEVLADAPERADGCDAGFSPPLEVLSQSAWQLARQRIAYNSQPLSDCSGILHRVLDELRDRCDGAFAPSPEQARSSRDLAAWYQDRGLLIPTPELGDIDRWLAPGAITFYTSPRSRAVEHVVHTAVVIDVQRDAQGRVQEITLFHGRSPGKVASFTSTHRRDAEPALGNGREALFAIAYPHPQIARTAPALADGLADAADAWDAGL